MTLIWSTKAATDAALTLPAGGKPSGGKGVPVQPSGDDAKVEFSPQNQMADDITHLPAVARTGPAPGRSRQSVQVLPELHRCGLDELNTVSPVLHVSILLSQSIVSPSRLRNEPKMQSVTPHSPRMPMAICLDAVEYDRGVGGNRKGTVKVA